MFQTGLVSITFRQLTTDQIISLAVEGGVNCVEWGSDVHVPVGDFVKAKEVHDKTLAAGLVPFSYGSYYRLCTAKDPEKEFELVAKTASILGAGIVRIWAGKQNGDAADEEYLAQAITETILLAKIAERYSLTICYEYHRGTLTEDAKTALALMERVNCENVRLYWQPNPDITLEQNLEELQMVLPYVQAVHVFQWIGKNVRYPLADGEAVWKERIAVLKQRKEDCCLIVEFVVDDQPEQFLADAKALNDWAKE